MTTSYDANRHASAQEWDGLGLSYLYSDHLGSISASTNATGGGVTRQYFDAWGKRLSGSVTQTRRSFTGQYLDDTGLLFYNARYYDPQVGRFISADSIVPGNAAGGMDGVAYKPLTVDFHEPGFAMRVAQENQFGPWYTLSDNERQELGSPFGPATPQALNRYAYVLNNPIQYIDPSGHLFEDDPCRKGCGGIVVPPPPGPLTGAGRLPQAVVDAGTVTVGSVLLANPPQASSRNSRVKESRWQQRETDMGPRKVRRLRDSEVPREAHRQKNKGNPLGPRDSYYVDEDGNLYSGNDKQGELTYEGNVEDYDE